jgi:integrase
MIIPYKFHNMNFLQRLNRDKTKVNYYFDFGRGKGQRPSTNIFTYVKPKNQTEKNHNKESFNLLDTLKSQAILEKQAIGTGYIPKHRFKDNFLEYYQEYIKLNKKSENRSLECTLTQLKKFAAKDHLAPIEITENFCVRFRQFLLDNLRGETPGNYFARFKRVLKTATKDGYYRHSPAEDVNAKSGKCFQLKENLEANEYIKLLNTPCFNVEVRDGFILSCYTALRWCDVKKLSWCDIEGDQLQTRIIQRKTGEPLTITLHPIARAILQHRRERLKAGAKSNLVFLLPTHNGALKLLDQWCRNAGIKKHITWNCARLSFSILLTDANVDDATVSLLLGHTTTKHVRETYKRHRPKDKTAWISKLPSIDLAFLN